VPGERGARLVEGLEDGSVVVLDRDPLGGERAVSIGRAEWAVRRPLLVQARRDDVIVEDSGLALSAHSAPPRIRRAETLSSWFHRSRPPWASITVSSRSLITSLLCLRFRLPSDRRVEFLEPVQR
jgi:hypothetical protein